MERHVRLSACLIVKDEEKTLRRCIDSIIDHVDEVIVVDTGSTDGTIDILEYYTASFTDKFKYIQEPWNGSFADMRNISMDLATGDVLFIIDADEYVEEGENWDVVRMAINQDQFVCGLLSLNNVVGGGSVVSERVMHPRFLLNAPEIRYKYAVHNQIDFAYIAYANKMLQETGKPGLIVHLPFEMVHTGYALTPEQVADKYTGRIDICRREIQKAVAKSDREGVAYYNYQLALFLTMTGGVNEALNIFERLNYDNLSTFNRWYAHYVATRAYMKNVHDNDLQGDDEEEMLTLGLSHCAGMFDAIHAPKVGQDDLYEEPATWMLTGVLMVELSRVLNDCDETWRNGVIMMIEAFLRSMYSGTKCRCAINAKMLYEDIRGQFEEDSTEYALLDTTDLQKGISSMRDIQRALNGFDESIMNLVNTEYY